MDLDTANTWALTCENLTLYQNVCKYCKKNFANRSNLYKHSRRIHKEVSEFQIRKTIPCIQQGCNEDFRTLAAYRRHMTLKHEVTCETDHLSFRNIEDFFTWLEEEEKRTSTHYILKSSPLVKKKKCSKSEEKYRRYYCHRSGKYTPSGKGLRSLKAQGSSKIGFYCTSSILVVERADGVTVTYNKTHHGHNRLLGHLHLSEKDRTSIAIKLAKGVPKQHILHDIRSSAGNSLQRSHLTSRKDLHNIAAAFGITPDSNLHNDSAVDTKGSKESPTNKKTAGRKKNNRIAVIGSNQMARDWAMLFTSAGYSVAIYDKEPTKVTAALESIQMQLMQHEENGVLRGQLSSQEQFQLIKAATSLADCVKNAKHVQECISDDIESKKTVFQELDALISNRTVLCSSTGLFPASQFASDMKRKKQVIVGHPANPSYFLPLLELVPAPWTDRSVTERTQALMLEIGQKPVILHKEVQGFAHNRIQCAVLNECWRLVEDGVMSVKDVDTVISNGLGMNYAFMGPLETAYVNGDGMVNYCQKHAARMHQVSKTSGSIHELGGEMAQRIENELAKRVPLDKIPARRLWRDSNLAALAKLKNQDVEPR